MAEPLVSGAIVFAVGQGNAFIQRSEAPPSIFLAHAGMMGASKIASDMFLKESDSIQRALVAGGLYCGLCFLFYKDENFVLNGALGVGASYAADVVVPRPTPKEHDY
jgi:hypothetical protein